MPKQNDNEPKGVSRRDFIKTTGVGALAVGLGESAFTTGKAEASQAVAASKPAEKKRPSKPYTGGESLPAKPYNVLFILTDQEQYIPDLLGKGH